jgi:hypothetical protein
MIPINLAIEDELSGAVLRRLLRHANRDYHVGNAYGRGGNGYLRKTIAGWNSAARGRPFIVLTDLDNFDCAPTLIKDWLGVPRHNNLLFRVAVREVEAWLLADITNLPRFLNISPSRMPGNPEQLADPKKALVDLARTSRSATIRNRLVPKSASTAKQGPDYNSCLSEFVSDNWNVDQACENSASLQRTVERLATFSPVWAHRTGDA